MADGQTIKALSELLNEGDLIIDGGNSKYIDDQRHAEELSKKSINFGRLRCVRRCVGPAERLRTMCGGDADDVAKVKPIFDALKPEGEFGYVHAGGVGGEHFTKMVHNGIEYGIMQCYAEGYELMAASPIVENVTETMNSWREGTVIRSWLLDLAVKALQEDPGLSKIRGYAQDSGEGRWTIEAAIDNAVPLPSITASLFARFASRQDDSPTMKMVAALRNQFGGHAVGAVGDSTPPPVS